MASVLLAEPNAQHWGYDVKRKTGLRTGVLYPILHRLLEAGWVEDEWVTEPDGGVGPARRNYMLTESGMRELGAMRARTELSDRHRSTKPSWQVSS